MKLEKIIRQTQKELKMYTANFLKSLKYDVTVHRGFVYAKGTVPVLLVAHLDTVHRTPVQRIFYTKDGRCLMSPEGIGGDDRCGVYMALSIAEKLRCHILFCEDEETGGIGATEFTQSGIIPDVNYIVEFDRRGCNDAVFYDCDNPDFTKFVTGFGFVESFGSFSDISIIAPELKIAAVNLSCGYYNAHTQHEYIDTLEMQRVIDVAMTMIVAHSEKYEYIDSYVVGRYNWRQDVYSYTPLMRDHDKNGTFLSVKPIGAEFTVVGPTSLSWNEEFFMGEDDNVYEYIEDFDVVVLYSGYVLNMNGEIGGYADMAGEEDYLCDVVTKEELFDLYEDAGYDLDFMKSNTP